MNKYFVFVVFGTIFLFSNLSCSDYRSDARVVIISIDGLRSDAITALGPEEAPYFHYLMKNGVYTLNARTDDDSTSTLPNHISMLTGLPVRGKRGHNIADNYFGDKTIHDFHGTYVYSIFDTLKKYNRKTALIGSKPKLAIFSFSYIVKDSFLARKFGYNKHAKIDYSHTNENNDVYSLNMFLEVFRVLKPHFIFIHFSKADSAGHKYGWDIAPDSKYLEAVKRIDKLLAIIIKEIRKKNAAGYPITVIITSDHGGLRTKHQDISNKDNFTIPFIVWGSGVAEGKDLYMINKESRKDPGEERISLKAPKQPIRNSDAGNLALYILDLPPIKNSIINAKQDLKLR